MRIIYLLALINGFTFFSRPALSVGPALASRVVVLTSAFAPYTNLGEERLNKKRPPLMLSDSTSIRFVTGLDGKLIGPANGYELELASSIYSEKMGYNLEVFITEYDSDSSSPPTLLSLLNAGPAQAHENLVNLKILNPSDILVITGGIAGNSRRLKQGWV